MFLNRCSTHLNKINVSASFLRSHPIINFSSDNKKEKKSEDKSDKKIDASATEQKERIKNLLSKLSKNSDSHIVRKVETAKPVGYKKIVEKQNRESYYPKKPDAAVKAVAKEIGSEKVVNDLLDSINSTRADKNSENLDVVVAMMQTSKKLANKKKIEMNSPSKTKDENLANKQRPQYMGRFQGPTRFSLNDKNPKKSVVSSNVNARASEFNGTPLNIFEVEKLVEHQSFVKTWNKAEQHEYRLKMSLAPRNYFEKMAYWTELGKIWKFPIDNEQGLDTEHQTPFTDHIFLEDLIESWCPKKGAVRNFMELICIGLSKNPYLSVQEKRDHIEWYRNYFDEKSHILQNAIEQNELQLKQAATKQIN